MVLHRLAVLCCSLLFAAFAQAQTKPYEPTPATYDRSLAADPGLTSAIDALRKAVEARDINTIRQSLAKNFTAITCKPDPTFQCLPGRRGVKQPSSKLSPVQRMEQGMCCQDTPRKMITREIMESSIFGQLSNALEGEIIANHPEIGGSVCIPAQPAFDRRKAALMAKAADIEPFFLRVSQQALELREKPAKDAKIIATIPAGSLVPLVADMAATLPYDWNAIALPQGGLGYTAQGGLNESAPPTLCLAREGSMWKINLFIAREE